MLSEELIQLALHAGRVVPLAVENPHGPLGLEQVAAAVDQLLANSPGNSGLVSQFITLRASTWEKLNDLARKTADGSSRPVTAGEIASALLEQIVAGNPS